MPFLKYKYRSYSVIRRTVFFKKFLISTKNYRQSLGASYRRIFSRNIFFGSQLRYPVISPPVAKLPGGEMTGNRSYWYEFKQIKEHTVLVIDFYKYVVSGKNRGGSEKNRLSCVLLGIYSSSL